MIELWIPVTIAAAFFQNLRSALQKYLQGRLTTTGATFVRFGYGFPVALAYVGALHLGAGYDLPQPSSIFFVYAAIGGVAQILATACLLATFTDRNFAVGTAYSKTETAQTALFGIVLLGDRLTAGAAAGIAVSLVGVVALSLAKSKVAVSRLGAVLVGPTARLGLGSGALFGISAVSYRAASLSLADPAGGPGFLIQAAYTLAWVTFLQTALMLAYLRLREPGSLIEIVQAWRPAIWVGLSGVAGSIGWFTALTIESAAYVRALGQIEIVFTFIVSVMIFRERTRRVEVAGVLLIIGGILILLLI
jgi:drug/metabolite transporter (DMT)-like permease